MAHFHVKTKKGRPYLYVREIARVDGKPKVVSQVYIGSPERVAALAKGEQPEARVLKVQEYGALWLAALMDADIDLASLIDGVVPRHKKETGPSIGEYFLYCVFNRMVEARSKNSLASWYQNTAIQQIRPVDLDELTSQRYWEKWDRVTEGELDEIVRRFFKRIFELESPSADCLLFDTTNYYTFMASDTESELAMRGNNKEGRHNLRQVGLGLLVDRETRLPLHYAVYPGNRHDSKEFGAIMDEMFGVVCGLKRTKERLTVVMDKGMNSHENFSWIDDHGQIHFVTTYSTYFSEELTAIGLEHFEPVDTTKNQHLAADHPEDVVRSFRTKGEYWGKERSVVVTYNPRTARKQMYTFNEKLERLREELLDMRAKVRDQEPQWRSKQVVWDRYIRLCEHLHLANDLFDVELTEGLGGLTMKFAKNAYRVEKKCATFGKNIIITDNIDWTTTQIIEANLDRWKVEDRFRQSKDDDLVGTRPLRHWTDSKIRCHLFTCVAAMTYLRRMELKLQKRGLQRTAESVMEDMQKLHSVLEIAKGKITPTRRIETPSETQSEVLLAMGYTVDAGGVLQKTDA